MSMIGPGADATQIDAVARPFEHEMFWAAESPQEYVQRIIEWQQVQPVLHQQSPMGMAVAMRSQPHVQQLHQHQQLQQQLQQQIQQMQQQMQQQLQHVLPQPPQSPQPPQAAQPQGSAAKPEYLAAGPRASPAMKRAAPDDEEPAENDKAAPVEPKYPFGTV
eukprot:136668-Prymnesium_polylepis.1